MVLSLNPLAFKVVLVLLILVLHVPLMLAIEILLLHLILTLLLLLAKRHTVILRIKSIPSLLHILLEFLFVCTDSVALLLHYTEDASPVIGDTDLVFIALCVRII